MTNVNMGTNSISLKSEKELKVSVTNNMMLYQEGVMIIQTRWIVMRLVQGGGFKI